MNYEWGRALESKTSKKRVVLIDHEDSFTYNIKAWLEQDERVDVRVLSYQELPDVPDDLTHSFDLVVFSPGPGCPEDYPGSLKFLRELTLENPFLGICLGMQMMMSLRGIKVQSLAPIHGKVSTLECKQHPLFKAIDTFQVARYHSLAVKDTGEHFDVLARSPEGYVMLIAEGNHLGLQFHPESFLTQDSVQFRKNLLGQFWGAMWNP